MSGPKKRKVKEESNENVGANCGFEVANKHNSFNDHTRRVTKVLKWWIVKLTHYYLLFIYYSLFL